MTLDETRQLGIEFERRIQTMIPETESVSKLDTETIYSYLNLYQDKFVRDIYRTIDKVPTSNAQSYIESVIRQFVESTDIPINLDAVASGQYVVLLPPSFGLYIDSYSNVSESYRRNGADGNGNIPNIRVTIIEANELISKPYDNMRILRNPVLWFTLDNEISIIYDSYTKPNYIRLNYYRLPKYMDIMNSVPCELPLEAFEDIVSGAVDLYAEYVAGAEARKKLIQQRQNKKQEDD